MFRRIPRSSALGAFLALAAIASAQTTSIRTKSLQVDTDANGTYQTLNETNLAALLTTGVLGPGSSTDNALARWDGTTGTLLQGGAASLTDGGLLSSTSFGTGGAGGYGFTGDLTTGLFSSGAGVVSLATSGTTRLSFNGATGTLTGTLTASGLITGNDGVTVPTTEAFQIGGFDVLKAPLGADDSLFFGRYAGNRTATGQRNYIIGTGGSSLTTGNSNVAIGSSCGNSLTTGELNVFLGLGAGNSATTMEQGVMIGRLAGYSATTGIANVFVGESAGRYVTTGYDNVLVGSDAGASPTDSGHGITTGNHNTAIGNNAGYSTSVYYTGDSNTAVGHGANWGASATATCRTAIGVDATNTADNQVMLGRSSDTVVVPGAFDAKGNATIGDASGDAFTVASNAPTFTNVTTGTPTAVALFDASNVLRKVSTLTVPLGGTGASTFTSGYVLTGNGTSAITASASVAAYDTLKVVVPSSVAYRTVDWSGTLEGLYTTMTELEVYVPLPVKPGDVLTEYAIWWKGTDSTDVFSVFRLVRRNTTSITSGWTNVDTGTPAASATGDPQRTTRTAGSPVTVAAGWEYAIRLQTGAALTGAVELYTVDYTTTKRVQ